MRKTLTVLATVATVAVAAVAAPTGAEARWGWRGPGLFGGLIAGGLIAGALAPRYYGYGYPGYYGTTTAPPAGAGASMAGGGWPIGSAERPDRFVLQCNDPGARGRQGIIFGGNGLQTQIPTNWSDYIRPFGGLLRQGWPNPERSTRSAPADRSSRRYECTRP
jgi:hypothetical protein